MLKTALEISMKNVAINLRSCWADIITGSYVTTFWWPLYFFHYMLCASRTVVLCMTWCSFSLRSGSQSLQWNWSTFSEAARIWTTLGRFVGLFIKSLEATIQRMGFSTTCGGTTPRNAVDKIEISTKQTSTQSDPLPFWRLWQYSFHLVSSGMLAFGLEKLTNHGGISFATE